MTCIIKQNFQKAGIRPFKIKSDDVTKVLKNMKLPVRLSFQFFIFA
jgi:hypothetical protein